MKSIVSAIKFNYKGVILCAVFAVFAYYICQLDFFVKFSINSLTLALVLGIFLGNVFVKFIPKSAKEGIVYSGKHILRFAIVLYGFRITFAQIFDVGLVGLVADVTMLVTTYFLGYYFGTRILKLDKDLCILTSIGSAICGAAAVLGCDSLLKAKPHKVSLAVATVVLFGTISMFLFPVIFKLGFLTPEQFGIYIGSCVHEVAQVVAAGAQISPEVCDNAVIVKLTRVMMLVPFLFFLSRYMIKKSGDDVKKVPMPMFAVMFVIVCGFNSLNLLPDSLRLGIVEFDIFLLTLAMFALGLETNIDKIKNLGFKPILLAFVMFVWLVGFGFLVNKVL